MAHRIFGIDIGESAIKVAELHVGLRSLSLADVTIVALSDRSRDEERSAEINRFLQNVQSQIDPGDDICIAISGRQVLLRHYDIPLTDPKKIHAVVANEMVDDIPWDQDDVLHDELILRGKGKVLVAAVRRETIESTLAQYARSGIEPRQISVSSLSYAGAGRRLFANESVLFIDIGKATTEFCFVNEGYAVAARTLSLGASELQSGLQLTRFMKEIALTLESFSSVVNLRPTRISVCGGGALIPGVCEAIGAELAIPAAPLCFNGDPQFETDTIDTTLQTRAALAISVALECGRRDRIDFRRGEFSFKIRKSIFREKAIALGICCAVIVLVAFVSSSVKLYALNKEAEMVTEQLRRSTSRVLGQAIDSPQLASKKIKRGARGDEIVIPSRTVVDVVELLSTRMPSEDDVKIDIVRLDVKVGKTYLKGTADSRAAIGNIIQELKRDSCFAEISSGKISEVAGDKKQFSLSISTRCF